MIAKFLRQLYDDGRLRLDTVPAEVGGLDDLQGALIEIDRDVRMEFPGECPALDPQMAHWAAQFLFKACHLLANRDLPVEAIHNELDVAKAPEQRSASALYSVDLTFRFLTGFERLASVAASEDPLVQAIHAQGEIWPLSSIGMPISAPKFDLEPILESPALSLCYAERIILRKDKSRLGDPATAALVREALGDFPDLCPEISSALTRSQSELAEEDEKES